MSFCKGEWLNITKRGGRGQKEVEKRTDKIKKNILGLYKQCMDRAIYIVDFSQQETNI